MFKVGNITKMDAEKVDVSDEWIQQTMDAYKKITDI